MNNIELVQRLRSVYPKTDNPNAWPIYQDMQLVLDALERTGHAARYPFDQTAIGSFSGPREGCDHFPPVKFDGWKCSRCGITAEELASVPGGIR